MTSHPQDGMKHMQQHLKVSRSFSDPYCCPPHVLSALILELMARCLVQKS